MTDGLSPFSQHESISSLMETLIAKASGIESFTVGRIVILFGRRGFAFILLMLSLLNLVIFMIPFVSIIFGLPMVIVAAQMAIGLHAPVFPSILRDTKIKGSVLRDGLTRAVVWMKRIETHIKPRLTFLTVAPLVHVHACFAMLMAMLVSLPIPGINIPPSIAIFVLAIGMLQRDGFFILSGYAIGVWSLWLFKSVFHTLHGFI